MVVDTAHRLARQVPAAIADVKPRIQLPGH